MSSSLTSANQQAVLAAIEIGTSQNGAAAAAGVNERTFYRWMERPEWREAVREAEGRFELAMVKRIRVAAAKGSWQAALVLLARRMPATWGEQSHLNVALEVSASERLARAATEEELEHLLADVVSRRDGPASGADDEAGEA